MLSRNKRRVFLFFCPRLSFSFFSCLPKINLPTEQRWLPLKEPQRSSTFQFPVASLWPLTPDLFNPVTKSTLSASCVFSELSSTTASLLRLTVNLMMKKCFFSPRSSRLLRLKHTHGLNYTARRTDSVTADCEKRALLPSLLTTDRKTQSKHLPPSPLLNLPPLRFFSESADQKSLNPFNSPVSARILTKPTQRDTLFVSARKDLHSHDTSNSATSAGGRKMPSGGPETEVCASAWVFLQCSFWPAAAAPSSTLTEREKELLQLSHVAAQALKVTSTRFTRGNQQACYAKCSLTVFNCPPCWWGRGGLFFFPTPHANIRRNLGCGVLPNSTSVLVSNGQSLCLRDNLLYSWHVNSHGGYQRGYLGCWHIYNRKSDALEMHFGYCGIQEYRMCPVFLFNLILYRFFYSPWLQRGSILKQWSSPSAP